MFDKLLEEFHKTLTSFIEKILYNYNEIKNDKGRVKIFMKKYPFFIKKNLKCIPFIYKIFEYEEFDKYKNTDGFKEYVFEYLIKKIRGIYKHGQSNKTEISCEKIVSDSLKNILTIAITKNTLLANKQFTTRFIKLLKQLGYKNLNEVVMVISSDKNDLDGNATHCKNLNEAWGKICSKNNSYMVIFICSNTTRIKDIYELLNRYNQPIFNKEWIKDIVIQYDEAHNIQSGIPTCREIIEHMLLYKFVKQVVPITASNNPIYDNDNPLWEKENINKMKLNYVNEDLLNSKILSSDKNYSSISDGKRCNYETIYKHKDFDNTINETYFKTVYGDKKDYNKFGYTNACSFPGLGDEELFMNSAKTILENDIEINYDEKINSGISNDDGENEENVQKLFLSDIPNFHVMVTPGRTIITREIMMHAAKQDYNPVVVAFYSGKINYAFKHSKTGNIIYSQSDKGIKIDKDNSEEFNDVLKKWLDKKKMTTRCVILLGNYQCVGESNTFVHCDYGYLRSVIILPGCNLTPEQNYQIYLRSNFLLGRFKNLTKETVIKFIVGPSQSIDDALNYEKINDEIVQELIDSPEESDYISGLVINSSTNASPNRNNIESIISFPIQYKIEDENCENVKRIRNIMKKQIRSPEDKLEFMINLINALKEQSVIRNNPAPNKLDNNNYTLTEFRCYKKDNNSDGSSYRFKGYYDHFKEKQPYKNGQLGKNECGIYCCIDRHIDSTNDHINNPNTFYMLYAY
jgi:hypothetical protein